jgi:plastocyanin
MNSFQQPNEQNQANTQPMSTKSVKAKNRSLYICAIGLLVIILVSSLIIRSRHQASLVSTDKTASSQELRTDQIVITKDGFQPATIQILTGSQVTWTNADEAPHQVAADPHPTHTSIPGFDSTKTLKKNESYSFIFDKPGTYTYHDEKNPLKTLGTIIVK